MVDGSLGIDLCTGPLQQKPRIPTCSSFWVMTCFLTRDYNIRYPERNYMGVARQSKEKHVPRRPRRAFSPGNCGRDTPWPKSLVPKQLVAAQVGSFLVGSYGTYRVPRGRFFKWLLSQAGPSEYAMAELTGPRAAQRHINNFQCVTKQGTLRKCLEPTGSYHT